MAKSIVVKSQVKEFAKIDENQLSVSEEYYSALEEHVKQIIKKSCFRAKLNSRNTVMKRDL
jgi:histone H3/H4